MGKQPPQRSTDHWNITGKHRPHTESTATSAAGPKNGFYESLRLRTSVFRFHVHVYVFKSRSETEELKLASLSILDG